MREISNKITRKAKEKKNIQMEIFLKEFLEWEIGKVGF